MDFIISKFNYWIYIVLMMIGFYAMISKSNLVKKLVGMNIFQTAIILFFISIGSKKGATIPIIQDSHVDAVNSALYMNPLPHVLMLTAIVVMVSTFGVAVALLIMIYRKYKTLEEDEILQILRNEKWPNTH
ncbi:MAG: NADH-quinone oxidoreductase subunit J [Nitrospinae bacterium RIFCSPLOWO2_12_39_16]|nr:MAG: NADH-quinone oxidoreductase subunit J [Nitrospinae bacterium RIFCSPLOWO2_02_39_17]OGW09305.1 MAG: NADH-quinone oxidoreductase subunit J [Nitrospinae bacterium RIFCSPLOWO2_12_39_16]OGW32130.1 MAG: NADH-quinone oxidoreductase subunit J [Nitrospirae bacterium GWF2_44_13]HLA48146.1 cation:proton antiporter subunit C [Nitrospinota bacterium]